MRAVATAFATSPGADCHVPEKRRDVSYYVSMKAFEKRGRSGGNERYIPRPNAGMVAPVLSLKTVSENEALILRDICTSCVGVLVDLRFF